MRKKADAFSVGIEARIKHGDFLAALQTRGWNQSEAARFLGVTPSTFGHWINMSEVPDWENFSSEITTRLFELTGKMPEELWPEEVFTEEFLASPKMLRRYRKVPVQLLAGAGILSLPVPTPEDTMEETERRQIINAVLKTIPKREQAILESRFFEGKTLEEISQDMGVTRERIRQLEQRAFRLLRHPMRARQLAHYA